MTSIGRKREQKDLKIRIKIRMLNTLETLNVKQCKDFRKAGISAGIVQ